MKIANWISRYPDVFVLIALSLAICVIIGSCEPAFAQAPEGIYIVYTPSKAAALIIGCDELGDMAIRIYAPAYETKPTVFANRVVMRKSGENFFIRRIVLGGISSTEYELVVLMMEDFWPALDEADAIYIAPFAFNISGFKDMEFPCR